MGKKEDGKAGGKGFIAEFKKLNYGNFITAIINFLITAPAIFCLIKGINAIGEKVKKKEEAPAAPTTKKCPYCLSEIALEATRCPHCTSRMDEDD